VTATGRRLLAEFTGTGLLAAVVVGSGIAATRRWSRRRTGCWAAGPGPVRAGADGGRDGLLPVIVTLARTGRTSHAAWSVGAWIGAAYWFTSSTSFANPAVVIGRTFTPTYAGIAPASAPAFIVAEILGGSLGVPLAVAVHPARPDRVPDRPPARLAAEPRNRSA
jgi:glycerol uptake facilitator-like aquaporin